MARQKRSQPSWWPVYVLGLIMVGLLFLAHHVAPSPGWRMFLQIIVVVVGYGLIAAWVETHSTTLLDQPPAEIDRPVARSRRVEILPPASQAQWQFYAGSDPVLVYGGAEPPFIELRSNGNHHLAETDPSLPEEAAK